MGTEPCWTMMQHCLGTTAIRLGIAPSRVTVRMESSKSSNGTVLHAVV